MFQKEAKEIGAWLSALPAEAISPILDLGSGDVHSMARTRPWIQDEVYAPLISRGVRIIHLDLEPGPGVDLVADILSEDGFALAAKAQPALILLCNILEHVSDPRALLERCARLARPGGYVLFTGPRSYPEHHCPIDNGFRPSPDEVAALIPWAHMLRSQVLATGYHWHEIAADPRRIMARKLRWLFTPYLVSMVLLQRI